MAVKRYKKQKGKADELFSRVIRSQGFCEAEGYDDHRCSSKLQWAQDYYETVYQKSIVPTKVNWEESVEFLKRIINEELTLEEARKMED